MTISNPKREYQAKPLQQYLQQRNSPLTALIKQAERLTQITQLFRSTIDSDLTQHTQVAKFDGRELVVIVENAAWATQLRYSIPDLIKLLRTQPEFNNLEKIRYRINREKF